MPHRLLREIRKATRLAHRRRTWSPALAAALVAEFLGFVVAIPLALGQSVSSVLLPVLLLNTNAGVDSWRDVEPSMATDGKGNWVVVWETLGNLAKGIPGKDQDIAVTRSTDDAKTWTRPAPLASWAKGDVGADSSPVVATDGRGNWVVAWQSMGTIAGVDSDILFVHSSNAGESWTPPEVMATRAASDSAQDFHPALLALPDGTWLAAWESNANIAGSGNDFDIAVSRSTDGGRHWVEPAALDPEASSDRDSDRRVSLAADAEGVVVAAWEGFAAKGGSLGTDWDMLYSRSTDAGRTWSASAPLSRSAAADAAAVDDNVTLAAGSAWVALWSSMVTPASGAPARRILKVVSEDGGATWSEPWVLVAPAPVAKGRDAAEVVPFNGREVAPSVAVLASGAFVVAWRSSLGEGEGGAPLFCFLAEARASCPAPVAAAGFAAHDRASVEAAPRVVASGDGAALVWSGDYDWRTDTSRDFDLRFLLVGP